jgi:hypothetical protein
VTKSKKEGLKSKKCDVDMGQGAVEDYLPLPTIAFDQKAELRIILF